MSTRKRILALVATGTAIAATVVRADLPLGAMLDFQDVTPGINVTVHSDTPSFNTTGNTYTTAGGFRYNMTPAAGYTFPTIVQPATPAPPPPNTTHLEIQTFCIDIMTGQWASAGVNPLVSPAAAPRPYDYPNASPDNAPMGDTRAAWLGVLTNAFWTDSYLNLQGGVDVDGSGGISPFASSSASSNVRYAALQLAIWEVVFQGATSDAIPSVWSLDSTNGTDFYLVGADSSLTALRNEANGMLAYMTTLGVGSQYTRNLGAFSTTNQQDQLVRTSVPVPEPSGLVLAGLGLLGLLSRRKARA